VTIVPGRGGLLTVAVNGTIVGARPSGLGQYALGVIGALVRAGGDPLVHTASPSSVTALGARVRRAPSWIRPERGALGHLARLLWCQTVLRARGPRPGGGVLLNTVPEGIIGSGCRQVTVLHDLIPLVLPAEYPRQQVYFRHWVPAVLRSSRAVIAVSEATRRHAIEAYGLRPDLIAVVPNGYDPDQFNARAPALEPAAVPYVLHVGNLLPHKNVPRLVEAVAIAQETVPMRLVLAGQGRTAAVAELRRLAGRAGVSLEARDYVAGADLVALYRGARAVALPSLAEGFCRPALEAMACGTPVVAASVSALPEVVGDAAILVDPLDAGSLAKALVRVFTDGPLRDELVARGLERAPLFAWDRVVPAIRAVLEAAA
jgi:glycosyltransferase involved in cell wall biosynthesis